MNDDARSAARSEDAAARAIAQREFARPLVLEAGAGTGKTATLVARIAAWCLGPGWERAAGTNPSDPDRTAADLLGRVSAITFTEAAAAEMAQRVEEALLDIEVGRVPVGVDPQALPDDDALIRERARALAGALDHLVVRTIHAWCRRLLARRPLDAGLHPAFEVDPEGARRQELVRAELEAELRKMVAGEGDGALLDVAAEGVSPSDVEAALELLFDEGISVEELAADPLDVARLELVVEDLLGRLSERERADGGRLAGVPAGKNKRTLAALAALADFGEGLERIRSDLGVRAKSSDSAEAWRELLAELRERVSASDLTALLRWATPGKLNQGEEGALAGDPEPHQRAARHLLDALNSLVDVDVDGLVLRRRLLLPLHERVAEKLHQQGILGFSDLLTATRDLLQNNPPARARIRREIDVLVVDEFQDTDPVQCAILRWLALDGPESERPSLFLVGDPKQSIYGWRSADLRAYSSFVREVLDEGGGALHRLSVNFRSVPAILDEVEHSLRPVMREEANLQHAFQPLLACDAHLEELGFRALDRAPVEYWVSSDWDAEALCLPKNTAVRRAAEIEATAIACDLFELHEAGDLAWKDAALLFRARGDQEIYLAALREAGIPYLVEKDQSYYRRREIIDAAAILRCILDPNDQLAMVSALRSPAIGVPDAAWLPLFAAGFPERFAKASRLDAETRASLAEAVDRAAAATPDSGPGYEAIRGWPSALQDALETLVDLRDRFEREPSDRFVEAFRSGLLLEASESARFLGEFRVANLDRFFGELSLSLRDGGDPKALLRRLRIDIAEGRQQEERRPLESTADAVRVLTIHQSKGLDFEHVYLPQLHKTQGRASESKDRIERSAEGIEARLLGCATPGLADARSVQKQVENAERVRTLYVAMTRAKKRLVLMGTLSESGGAPADSLLGLLQARAGNPEAIAALMAELASEEKSSWDDPTGARWRFPALAAEEAPRQRTLRSAPDAAESASPVTAAEEGAGLRRRVEAARRRARRRRVRSASDLHDLESGEGRYERIAQLRFGAEAANADPASLLQSRVGEADRDHAMLAGTAVHKLLEEWRFDGDAEEQLRLQREALRDRLLGENEAEEAELVLARVDEVLDSFRTSALFLEFHGMGDRIVAREVPVIRAPDPSDDSAAVWVETGSIDLVYRADEDGRLIVADYKTDRAVDEAAIEACRERYAEQGRFYCESLARALALDETPRFELWLLRAGRKVSCEWNGR